MLVLKLFCGVHIEYMYNVYPFNNASYEPRHEKIFLRGLRPGRRHKRAVHPQKLAGDLNLVLIRRELVPSDLRL